MSRLIQRWMLIQPGEGVAVLYPFLVCLMVGAGFGLGRASSDAVLITRVGVDKLPHLLLMTGPALMLIGAVYAIFVDRVRTDVLFRHLLLALGIYVAGTTAIMDAMDGIWPAALYVLGYMVGSEILIVHLNHYSLSFFDPIQSRRLFPIVAAGTRIGGISGGVAMGVFSSVASIEAMALAWVAVLLAAVGLILAKHKPGAPGVPVAARARRKPLADLVDGWRFARSSRLLQFTGVGIILLVMLISMQDYLTNAIFAAHFKSESELAGFLGWFVAGANAMTLILQVLLTNRLLSRLGVKAVNLIFPLTTLAGFAALAGAPGLASAIAGRLNGQTALPAFRHPAANLFFHAFPARFQGRARAFVTGAMLPVGFAVSGAVLILIPPDVLVDNLAWGGLALAALLLIVEMIRNRYYGECLMSVVRDLVFLGHGNRIDLSMRLDPATIRRIGDLLVEGRNPDFVESCVEILARGAPESVVATVRAQEANLEDCAKDRILNLLSRRNAPQWSDLARRWLVAGDMHLRTTALRFLVQRAGDPCRGVVEDWLVSPMPRLKAAAAEVALANADADLGKRAAAALATLFDSADVNHVVAGIIVVERIGDAWLGAVAPFVEHDDARLRAAAVRCLVVAPRRGAGSSPDLDTVVERALADKAAAVRAAAVPALSRIAEPGRRLSLLARAIEDADADVRLAAERIVSDCLPTHPDALRESLRAFAEDFSMQAALLRALAEQSLPQRSLILREVAAVHVEQAARKEDKARWLLGAKRTGAAGVPPTRIAFLYEALCEDAERHLDMALLAIEGLKTGIAVSVVRAGIVSRDRRLRALAIESLRAIDDDKLVARTRIVLEQAFEMRGAGAATADSGVQPGSIADEWREMLRWCDRHGSRWLKRCAESIAVGTPAAEVGRGY